MRINERNLRAAYIFADYLSTIAGVMVFTFARFFFVDDLRVRFANLSTFFATPGLKMTLLLFPFFMLGLYYLSGYYVSVVGKSRVKEFLSTLVSVSIGSIVFFMVVLLNDVLPRRVWNYEILLLFFVCLFVPVYLARLSLTSMIISRTSSSSFEEILILAFGSEIPEEVRGVLRRSRKRIKGLFDVSAVTTGSDDADLGRRLEAELERVGASSFMVVLPEADSERSLRLLGVLYPLDRHIYVSPDDYMMLVSRVPYDNLLSEPLVDISRSSLSDSVVAMKRMLDVAGSAIGLVVVSPLMAMLAVLIKLKAPGPVFFSQERVGYHKKTFMIHKFRTMRVDAEAAGPSLSSDDDPRVTGIGRFMRKYRLDELPNLWNVLCGDMSLVGPRPEREYYLRKLHKIAPHCALLHQVRPGLTSLGMVKFGYASNVDDMAARLKYDLLYIQNISISLDLKIMFYTVRTIFRGEGK